MNESILEKTARRAKQRIALQSILNFSFQRKKSNFAPWRQTKYKATPFVVLAIMGWIFLSCGSVLHAADVKEAVWTLKRQTKKLDKQRIEGRGKDFVEWTSSISPSVPEELSVGDIINAKVSVSYCYGSGEHGQDAGMPKYISIAISLPNGSKFKTWDLVPNYCRKEGRQGLPDPMPRSGTFSLQARGKITEVDINRKSLTIGATVSANEYCWEGKAYGKSGFLALYVQPEVGVPRPDSQPPRPDAAGGRPQVLPARQPDAIPPVGETLVLLEDTFDSENEGKGKLNYAGFNHWDVKDGTVDLIGRGLWDFFLDHGLYVDLDGSTRNAGTLSSKKAFSLEPGTYRLEFDLAGNPSNGPNTVSVRLDNVYDDKITLKAKEPFRTIARDIVVSTPTNAKLVFQHAGGDNIGLILDNILLTKLPIGKGPTTEHKPPTPPVISAKSIGRVYLKRKKSSSDFVGRYDKLRGNGSPDSQFRLHITAPGKTITSLDISNIDGQPSWWDTTPANQYWLLAVIKKGELLNRADGHIEISLGKSEEVYDLFVQDNNSIAAGKTNFELTVAFQDGSKQVLTVHLNK